MLLPVSPQWGGACPRPPTAQKALPVHVLGAAGPVLSAESTGWSNQAMLVLLLTGPGNQ